MNSAHAPFDPIKFDVFRAGLVLIHAATLLPATSLIPFKKHTRSSKEQVRRRRLADKQAGLERKLRIMMICHKIFVEDAMLQIRERYDEDLFELISAMTVLDHTERLFPNSLKMFY